MVLLGTVGNYAASDGSDNVSRFSALGNLTYFFNVSDLKAISLGETAFFSGSCFALGGWSVPTNLYSVSPGGRCLLYFFLDAVCNGIKSSRLVIVDM